jgi:2-polyprenyl-3-methyl-5-hydroxy-6-metoxy-1,4-benzoquinol methylase
VEIKGRKTTVEHWEAAWRPNINFRLPSSLNVGVADLKRLLREQVRPGQHYLEIGCAPGKMLSWVSAILKARVAGLDFSHTGLTSARKLFDALNLTADLRCEDVFHNSFEPESFDVVASFGLVEHFDDPREVIREHVLLSKPGGVVLIVIPNYGGIYGKLQRHFDPDNLAIHNLAIMNPRALEQCAPRDLVEIVHAYPEGRFSPWMVSLQKRMPRIVAHAISYSLNGIALILPIKVRSLCPTLVLRMVRSSR